MDATEARELPPPPEVVFDRYFRKQRSRADRERYVGKQDLEQIADTTMRLLLGEMQKSINDAYQSQKGRISVRGGRPTLHFDYIQSTVPNAMAFSSDGYAFVGLTMVMFDQIAENCAILAMTGSVITMFGTAEPTEHDRRRLCTALFAILLQFVACHELGHHFHGHCPGDDGATALWEEFANDERLRGGLLDQAKELDADGFAVHMLLRNLVTGPRRAKLLELLGHVGDADDSWILAALVVAAGSFFFYSQRDFDRETSDQLEHPPTAVRMHFVMSEMVSWLSEHRPSSVASVTLDWYQRLMAATASALSHKMLGNPWKDQTAFMESEAGSEYLGLLHSSRSQLRDEMATTRWDLAGC